MAESVLLLVIKKIGIALGNGALAQASSQFSKYATQLVELQHSMGRVVRELRVMHDVLCQMDIRNRSDQVYEGWLDEVRMVAYVMEDMVDEYLHQVGQEHDMGCCFYLKKGLRRPRSLLSLNQIASNVKEIERDIAHLLDMKNRWVPLVNNGDTSSSNYILKRSQDLANISRSLDEEDLVGADKNREKLQQWLGGEDGECSVITLHGMGGLGKTALAANVYKKQREKFQCHAWVSISQTYSREDVLMNIIKELFKDRVDVLSNITTMDITCLEDTLKTPPAAAADLPSTGGAPGVAGGGGSASPCAPPRPRAPSSTPARRSARHGIGADGVSASDEDSLAKAMRRKASANLDGSGYLPLYGFAPFMVVSSACGEQRPIYGGVYTVGGHGEGLYYPTWVAA